MGRPGAKKIAVVGAGPAGSALATFCTRRGHDVTVFRKPEQPEVIVGESLLPFGNRVLSLLGVSMEGFVAKSGAAFVLGERRVRYGFEETERPTWTSAHQVKRVDFDARLLSVAVQAGARIQEETVTELPRGFDWVVDASGRRRSLGRKLTSYESHPLLRNSARARHVPILIQPEGTQPGDITIYAFEGGWFWVIPLSSELTSVGLVTRPTHKALKWEDALDKCPELRDLLGEQKSAGTVTGHRDFTEYATSFCGDGWAVVGDAAFFLDPIFSSGVLFALEGAERLARVIDGELSAGDYEAQMRSAARLIEPLISAFYSGDFFDLGFLEDRYQEKSLRAGVVSLLAGDIFEDAPRMARVVSRRLPELAERVRQGLLGSEH
jgi:flavin-dependent dehydrogenase